MWPFLSVLMFSWLFFGCLAERDLVLPTNYESWQSPTTAVINYETPSNGTKLRKIYMNSVAIKPKMTSTGLDFEQGSIIARDLYPSSDPSPLETPIVTTFMIKAPLDPRSRAGWLWVTLDRKTGVQTINSGDFCITCHDNANEAHPYLDQNINNQYRDSVFVVPEEGI